MVILKIFYYTSNCKPNANRFKTRAEHLYCIKLSLFKYVLILVTFVLLSVIMLRTDTAFFLVALDFESVNKYRFTGLTYERRIYYWFIMYVALNKLHNFRNSSCFTVYLPCWVVEDSLALIIFLSLASCPISVTS